MTISDLLSLTPGTRFKWSAPNMPPLVGEVTSNNEGRVTYVFDTGEDGYLEAGQDDLQEFADWSEVIEQLPMPTPIIVEDRS